MQIVIPSKGRSDIIGERALRLFPHAVVCVGESEADAYSAVTQNLLVHPDSVTGIGPLRQWVLDNVEDETVVMVDDDVSRLYCLVGFHRSIVRDPLDIAQVVVNAAECARGMGARVFGFNQAWDIRKFKPQKPFSLCSWVGGVVGIIGRDLRYDTSLLLRADIDFCLQNLLKHRVIFQELRFSFEHARFEGKGGNNLNRSNERQKQEIEYLRRKWGKYLKLSKAKTTLRLGVNVERSSV